MGMKLKWKVNTAKSRQRTREHLQISFCRHVEDANNSRLSCYFYFKHSFIFTHFLQCLPFPVLLLLLLLMFRRLSDSMNQRELLLMIIRFVIHAFISSPFRLHLSLAFLWMKIFFWCHRENRLCMLLFQRATLWSRRSQRWWHSTSKQHPKRQQHTTVCAAFPARMRYEKSPPRGSDMCSIIKREQEGISFF